MEYQITLAIHCCTPLTFRFLAASWWNSFTSRWVPFRGFPPLSYPFIYTFEYHRTAVSQVSKSQSCISVKVDLFRCPEGDRKSPPLKYFRQRSWFWREIHSTNSVFIIRSQYIYSKAFVWVIHRVTLYHEGLIMNIYRNLQKAVYKKEDFKRRDRWRSFSISLNFYQAILHPSPQTRFMFDIKKLYIITRCANIYSRRNSTGRGELRSINPNSVEGDFHNPLTSRCETLDWQKLLAIL